MISHGVFSILLQGRNAYERRFEGREGVGRYYAGRFMKCNNCKQKGHMEKECPHPKVGHTDEVLGMGYWNSAVLMTPYGLSLTEHLFEQSVMARQVKRGFGVFLGEY